MLSQRWPCKPLSFCSILPPGLPSFLQTGATHAVHRPVSIIDPVNNERVDPFDRFANYQPFCRYLRGALQEPGSTEASGCDAGCKLCDLLVARRVVGDFNPDASEPVPIRYRCYMGLEELAAVISIGGFPVLVLSGQFRPPEGLTDVKTAIECLGRSAPPLDDVSPEMRRSASLFSFPPSLWTEATAIPSTKARLHTLAADLSPMPSCFERDLLEQARCIREIAQSYFDLAKGKAEAEIVQATAEFAAKASTNDLWKTITPAFDCLAKGLNVSYSAFFLGETEFDTTLNLRVYTDPIALDASALPHFNWRKASLKTDDARDTRAQTLSFDKIRIADRQLMEKGFRGAPNPFSDASALLPVRLPSGPFGLCVLGPQRGGIDLASEERFVIAAVRDLGTRALTLQLAQILKADRTDWENTAKLTGHRVRASIQGVRSQLNTIKAFHSRHPAFTGDDRIKAEEDLERGFQNLIEVSYGAESAVPGAMDPKAVSREFVPISEVLWSAVEDQQGLADQFALEIDVSPKIGAFPSVYVNRTLMRLAFINLINNAMKYSSPRPEERDRPVRIRGKLTDLGYVMIEIENSGLGIRPPDQKRVFDWGVRLAESHPMFKDVFGRGFGLWEVKYVVEGHGGAVSVWSEHYRKEPITNANIHQCTTTFCVTLPTALAHSE